MLLPSILADLCERNSEFSPIWSLGPAHKRTRHNLVCFNASSIGTHKRDEAGHLPLATEAHKISGFFDMEVLFA